MPWLEPHVLLVGLPVLPGLVVAPAPRREVTPLVATGPRAHGKRHVRPMRAVLATVDLAMRRAEREARHVHREPPQDADVVSPVGTALPQGVRLTTAAEPLEGYTRDMPRAGRGDT